MNQQDTESFLTDMMNGFILNLLIKARNILGTEAVNDIVALLKENNQKSVDLAINGLFEQMSKTTEGRRALEDVAVEAINVVVGPEVFRALSTTQKARMLSILSGK